MIQSNILRLKITGKCNRKCFFCHEEGGMSNVDEMEYSNDLDNFIRKFSEIFEIKSIAITGGEPLLHPNIFEIFANISKINQIEKISITTNGTIFKSFDFWQKLSNNKLNKVNISIPDIINNKEFDLLEKQTSTIKILNKLDIETNINMVVFNDSVFSTNVIKILLKHKDKMDFSITLLPNLSNYHYSRGVINCIINELGLKNEGVCENNFTSNIKTMYSFNNNIIYIKETKKEGKAIGVKGLCDNCSFKNECNEGFYAIRVEKKEAHCYVRTCLLRNDKETTININDFFDSDTFKILYDSYRNI